MAEGSNHYPELEWMEGYDRVPGVAIPDNVSEP